LYFVSLQAGDLYEKVNRNDEALQCYKKGYAYRRGNAIDVINILHATYFYVEEYPLDICLLQLQPSEIIMN